MKIDELSLEQYYLKEYMSAGACRYGALKRWQKEVLAKSFGYQAWRLKTAIDAFMILPVKGAVKAVQSALKKAGIVEAQIKEVDKALKAKED